MATIRSSVVFSDNTDQLKARILANIGTIDAMKSSVDRVTASMGGSGLFAAANKLVAAIDQLGGITKLTAAEQDRANATLDKAIEKYKTMGMTAPPAMIALSDSMHDTSTAWSEFVSRFDVKSAISDPLTTAKQGMSAFAESIGIAGDAIGGLVALGAVMGGLAEQTASIGAGFLDMSLKTGMSVVAASEFSGAVKIAGGDADTLSNSVFMLEKRFDDTGPAGDKARDAVAALGISVKDFTTLSPDQKVLALSDGFRDLSPEISKAGLVFDLFGRQGREILPTLLKPLGDLIDQSRALGTTWTETDARAAEEFQEKIRALQLQVDQLGISVGKYIIDPAAAFLDWEIKAAALLPHIGEAVGPLPGTLHAVGEEASYASVAFDMLMGAKTDLPLTAGLQDMSAKLQDAADKVHDLALSPDKLLAAWKAANLDQAVKPVTDGIDNEKSVIDGLNLVYNVHHQAALQAAKDAADEAAAADNVRIATAGYAGALQDVSGAVVYNSMQELAHGAKVDDVAKEYGVAKAYVEVFAQELKDEQQVIDDTSKAMIAHRETTVTAMDTIGKSLHDGQNVLMGMAVTMGDVTIAAKQWSEGTFTSADGIKGKFQEVDNVISLMPDLTDTAAAHMRALTNDTGTTVATLDKSIGLLDASLRNVERTSSGAFKTTISDLLLVSESAKLATDSVKAFQKAQDSGDTVGMAFAAGGEAMQGVGQFESIQSGQTPAAAGMAQMTETGAALGTMIMPGIGTAIGAGVGFIAGALASVFKDQSISNIARDAGKDFGTTFDKTTSDAILADMKSGMSETASELNNLTGIITDAGGITSANVTLMTSKFHDLFSMLQTGQMTVKQVNDQLQANFPALAAAATDATGRWSDGLKTIITLDQQAGLGTQAIADALKTQGTNLGTSFVAVAAALVDDKNSLAGLGAQAVTTYATMIASGSTAAEALSAISPGLASLQQSYKDLGLNVDDVGLKSLMMQDSINKGNPALIAGINGLASEFVALDNLGVMNTTQLSAMEVQGMAMYTKLQGGVAALGGDTKDALLPMQDYLHNAQLAAEKLGIPLDANTQMLIDQSKDAGIWQTALTPQDKLLQGMQTLVDKVSELLDHLNNIPSKINTTVTTTYDTTGAPPAGDPGTFAAQGGLVTNHGIQYLAGGGRVLAFTPRGSDTVPAMLTPGESVLTRRATSTLGTAAISALNRGGGRSSSGDASASVGGDSVIHTHVYIDGREVASSVNRVNDRTLQMRRKMGRA